MTDNSQVVLYSCQEWCSDIFVHGFLLLVIRPQRYTCSLHVTSLIEMLQNKHIHTIPPHTHIPQVCILKRWIHYYEHPPVKGNLGYLTITMVFTWTSTHTHTHTHIHIHWWWTVYLLHEVLHQLEAQLCTQWRVQTLSSPACRVKVLHWAVHKTSLVPRPIPFSVLQLALTVVHRNGRAVKNEEGLDHASELWLVNGDDGVTISDCWTTIFGHPTTFLSTVSSSTHPVTMSSWSRSQAEVKWKLKIKDRISQQGELTLLSCPM